MKTVSAITAFVLVQVVTYLFGAFVTGTFETNQWDADGKFFTALFSAAGGVILAVVVYQQTTTFTKGN